MNEPADLLPPNASATERNLSKTIARLSDIPMMVRKSWSPVDCPVELLPWLAWAFSVDEWDENWNEEAKRQIVANSAYLHKKKGTLAAIKRAVAPLGYIIETIEWFQDIPRGVPYTFRVVVGVIDTPLTESVHTEIIRLIETYKNERSHMSSLTVKAEVSGSLHFGTVVLSGVDTTVYPWVPENLSSVARIRMDSYERTVDQVSVYPESGA